VGVNQGRFTLNQYEIAVLYHPDLEIDLEKATSRVEKIFTDNGGKVVNSDNWGKRKLAYPVKKNEHGVYVFYTVDMPAEAVRKVESVLNITDEVLRFLITRPDLKAVAKAEAEKAVKAKRAAERASRDASDEDNDKDEA
jgi:small subunit ribosomal protein S6